MLLLVTSIEKEFGLKVPSEQIGREVFANVTTLAKYVSENAGKIMATNVKPTAANEDYLARLPHGEPFRFVSRIEQIKPGESARAVWSLKGDESFFAGHFPGNPLVPGVLISEALAQLAGIVGASAGNETQGKLAHIDVRFDCAVAPPAEIILNARQTNAMGHLRQFEVWATLKEQSVARGTLTLNLSTEQISGRS